MDKSPFIRLEEAIDAESVSKLVGQGDSLKPSGTHFNFAQEHPPLSSNNCEFEENQRLDTSNPPQFDNAYPAVVRADSRFRGSREVDISQWDEDVSAHLRTMRRTPGDLCDCIRPCRRPLKLRSIPTLQKMSENAESGYPLPGGVVWFVRDVSGFLCMLFTWLLIGYAEFVVVAIILPQSPSLIFSWIFGIVYHIIAFLAFVSHVKSVFTDPGTIPLANATRDAVLRIYQVGGVNTSIVRCPKCLCIKPERTHHCSCCKRCIRKMDHHCPWVNNCVGEGNQKYFVLFNFYIFLMSITVIIMLAYFFISCFAESEQCHQRSGDFLTLLNGANVTGTILPSTMFCVGLGFESVLFALFTVAIGCSQLSAICKDETAVESLKRDRAVRANMSRRDALSNVFGRPCSWRWFSPFSPPPPLLPSIPPIDISFNGVPKTGAASEANGFFPVSYNLPNGEHFSGAKPDIELRSTPRNDAYVV